jgi:hypothetical protein
LKRGQITIYVIVGLAIVLLVSIFYMMNSGKGLSILGPPGEIKSIVDYTSTCIEELAADGAFIESMQGGYISLPEGGAPGSYIENGFDIPMWFFNNRDLMPSKKTMEQQIADYVDENLLNCLNLYVPFAHEYDITFDQLPQSRAKITKSKVNLKTTYPLKISKKGSEQTIHWNEFNVDVDTNLGEMYELASEIMIYENKKAFLEDYTDEMIASSDYLPYEGMEITCQPRYWFEKDLKEYTQTLVMHNLHYLQFVNTDFRETGMLYYDKQYKVRFTNNDYEDYEVNVIYDPSWGMDFEALPSDNGVVEPYEFKIADYIKSCFKVYHEKYNVEYPVIIQVVSKKGESFQYATMVYVKQNQPNRNGQVRPWKLDDDTTASKQFCAETSIITDYGLSGDSMITRTSTHNNRQNNLRIYAIDALYGYPDGVLADVNISYQCVKFRCDIGTTGVKADKEGLYLLASLPTLNTGFPECSGGYIIANKEGYHEAILQQTVSKETDGEQVNIDMYQLKEYDYGFRVVVDHNGIVSDRELQPEEMVMVTIRNEEQDFEKQLVWPSDAEYYNNLTLLLGDFTYDLEIILVDGDQLVGGADMEWRPSLNDLFYRDYVRFYLYKKDPLVGVASDEEMYELYEEAMEESEDYPPRFV